MKKISILFIILVSVSFVGCAGFGKSKDAHDWYGLMGPATFSKHENAQLAREKMKNSSVKSDQWQGYLGVVWNLHKTEVREFRITGTETTSFLVQPDSKCEEYLLPGDYSVQKYYGDEKIGDPSSFSVGPQTKIIFGQKYHWHAYATKNSHRRHFPRK